MHTTRSKSVLSGGTIRPVSLLLSILGFVSASLVVTPSSFSQTVTTPTTINIAETAKMTNARRLGVNIGTQDYWDSGQMMRQIMFRNPGFEAETWQSILHCKAVTATSCTDDDLYTGWPANFLKGAQVEYILGNAIGSFATVTSSTVANFSAGVGVTVNLSGVTVPPSVGDYLVARLTVPGNAQAGWWPSVSSGASLSTEFNDLSPNSPGKQALRVTVPAGQTASVNSYTDGYAGRSFLQMNGAYTLTFRAKSTGGSNNINVSVSRNVSAPPGIVYFNQSVALSTSWQDYSYTFNANDTGRFGSIQLSFAMSGASILLDDVALSAAAAPDNPTNYRNEVVQTLRKLNPGTLRYMDSGTNWGSSIDNMLAPDFARQRPGYSNFNNESDQIPMGLHDFLVLCQAVGTEPWYTMPTGMSLQEMSNLMDYLGGSASSTYGAKRAAMGQTAPWTSVFKTIHLEFGNEVWNTANPGATIDDPVAYGKRAGMIFTAATNSPSFAPNKFDFILVGFEVNPTWNQLALANSSNYNTIDVATYIFDGFNDASSIENIYGPMFAEPEALVNTSGGYMNQQAAVAAAATVPANLAVYESNISPGMGSATQAQVNSVVPSVGAGITASLNLLMAQRDLGVNNQNLFSLTGFQFAFGGAASNSATTTPIWGSVIDMGGQSNLQRPNFLSEQLANSAILPTLLSTSQTGANPTWNQPYSSNNGVTLPNAHYLQSFAYTDGTKLNVIVFNLSRTTALPVTFAGLNAPTGAVTVRTLTGSAITDGNDTGENVAIVSTSQTLQAGASMSLPPYSMTVISATAPYIPAKINSMSLTCVRSTLSPGDTTSCTPTVVGQGQYNSNVTWSVDQGTVSSAGVYQAPGSVPAKGLANLTITSVQDKTKTASFPIAIAPNTVTGVTVSCKVKTLGQGQNTNCSATVSGTGSYSNAYAWSPSGGSITPAGLLTAALTGSSMTVTATSTEDPSQSASTTIALTPVLTISNPVVTTTSTSITASWTTNMAARNGVGYGTTGGTTAGTPYDNASITNPTYTITGLTPGATYTLWLTSYTSTQNAGQTLSVTLPSGSKQSTSPSTITGVIVTCSAASIVQDGSTGCAATVSGTGTYSKSVTWSVSGGSINSSGAVTAPGTGTAITVKATSTQDPTKFGSYSLALSVPVTVSGVTVTCGANSLNQSGSTSCTAAVAGTGAFAKTVTWSVAGGGSITSSGVVTAPSTGTSITVKATSTQDTTKSGTYVVSLNVPVTVSGVTVSCSASSVAQSGSTSCTAAVAGTGAFAKTVTWSVAGGGSITSSGVVTAPSTGTSITVKATSTQDTTKSGTYAVSLNVPVTVSGVTVSCSASSVAQSGSTSCTAAVAGTGAFAKTVTWSLTGGGSITSAGVVTAPSTGTSITVKAISTQDTTKSGTFAITLNPVLTISNPVVTTTPTTITAAWTDSVAARNGVGYGTSSTATTGTPYDNNFITNPTYTLTGLTPGTTYYLLLTAYTPTQSTSKLVTVTLPQTSGTKSAVTSVSLTCGTGTLSPGGTTTCKATVAGSGSPSQAVTLTATAGTVSSSGAVVAPATGSSMTIKATSVQDPTKTGSYTIAIAQKLAISNPVITSTSTTITASWTTNIATRNGVGYGIVGGSTKGTPYDNNFITNPSYTLTGLTPGATYTLWLTSYNNSQNTSKILTVIIPKE